MNNEETSHKQHGATWSLMGVLMAPVLYLVFTPPVVYSFVKMGGMSTASPPPKWLAVGIAPYVWLCAHGPTQVAFQHYTEWWAKVMGLPNP